MTKANPHAAAVAAVRTAIAKAAADLAADLEAAGQAQLQVPALKVEARGQIATAHAIREAAKRSGWVL